MIELIIDSSTNLLYVGLNNKGIRDDNKRLGNNDNAAYVVDNIDKLLKRNNVTINMIDTIIVGIGPGSYTGIRAAVTVAKMLAYTKKITLKTISSLLLLSSGYNYQVTAAIDARRQHAFVITHNKGTIINNNSYMAIENIEKDFIFLNNKNIKIDLNVISRSAKLVTNVHNLEPNYLRKTEAEKNYDKKSKSK